MLCCVVTQVVQEHHDHTDYEMKGPYWFHTPSCKAGCDYLNFLNLKIVDHNVDTKDLMLPLFVSNESLQLYPDTE